MFGASLSHITAEAVTPEQLVHYVRAVSGRRALLCAGYAAYVSGEHAVLAAYSGAAGSLAGEGARLLSGWGGEARPPGDEDENAARKPDEFVGVLPEPPAASLEPALNELRGHCSRLTVLAPFRPAEAPADAASSRDAYWAVPLPAPAPGQKLRNMLARAGRELRLEREGWSHEHAALVARYLASRPLQPGTRAVFSALPAYAALAGRDGGQGAEGRVLLLAARRADGGLAGFCIGDYSALETAFYMFSFRQSDAPPGTADLLLSGLLAEGEALGHRRMNLGLAVNDGIAFFKKKWGARPFLPYVETSWDMRTREDKGFFSAFKNFFSGGK